MKQIPSSVSTVVGIIAGVSNAILVGGVNIPTNRTEVAGWLTGLSLAILGYVIPGQQSK